MSQSNEMAGTTLRRWFRNFARQLASLDRVLLAVYATLVAFGFVVLYSSSSRDWDYMFAHATNVLLSVVVLVVVALLSFNTVQKVAVPLYVLSLLLLLAVLFVGSGAKGAMRWLSLGGFRFQPSELAKVAVPMMLAWYLHRYQGRLRLSQVLLLVALVLVPVVLIIRQPDLGTGLVVLGGALWLVFLAGLSWKYIVGASVLALASMPLTWQLLHPYQQRRVLTLLDPSSDPLGAGYHIIQSVIAMGSGGLFGKGWLQGTQTHLDFIPERHTDFVMAVIAEEFGFVGVLVLLALYGLLIGRMLHTAFYGGTDYERLLAGALTGSVFTYVVVNMGMTSGLLPVVGVPLPLVSYGGTAMVSLSLALGLVLNLQRHRKMLQGDAD